MKIFYKDFNEESYSTTMATISGTRTVDNSGEYWIIYYNDEAKIGVTNLTINDGGGNSIAVSISLPLNYNILKGDIIGEIEYVKVVGSIISPVSGKLIEINNRVVMVPSILDNGQAENESNWIYKIKI